MSKEVHSASIVSALDELDLISAANKGNQLTVDTLLQQGVSPFAIMSDGTTALLSATSHGHFTCAKLLLSKAVKIAPHLSYFMSFFYKDELSVFVNRRDAASRTALWYSVRGKEAELAKQLLDAGALIDETIMNETIEVDAPALTATIFRNAYQRDFVFHTLEGDETVLHRAASRGKIHTVLFLLAHKQDINARNLRERRTALHAAVEGNYGACVDAILEARAAVDASNRDNVTPLHTAAYRNFDQCAAVLVAYGADVNRMVSKKFDKGFTSPTNPLLLSIENKSAGSFIVLYRFGKALANYAPEGELPLIVAVRKNLPLFISILVSEPGLCEVHAVEGPSLSNALHIAVIEKYAECVRALLESNVDLTKMTADRSTVLHLALDRGNEEIAAMLLERMYFQGNISQILSARNQRGDIPLMVVLNLFMYPRAVSKNDNSPNSDSDSRYNLVELLIKYGSPLDTPNVAGEIPLMRAVDNNVPQFVDFMLRSAAKKPSTAQCEKALFRAFMHEVVDCVRVLIDAGTDPNCGTESLAPLQRALYQSRVKVVQLMLENGVRVDLPDSRGATPLEYLCVGRMGHNFSQLFEGSYNKETVRASDYMQCFDLLVKHGAKLSLKTNAGKKIAALAEKKCPELCVCLSDFSEPQTVRHEYTVLHLAVLNGNGAFVNELLKNNASPHDRANDGETALHLAARQGSSTMVSRLFTHGADPNCVSQSGDSPLHVAVTNLCFDSAQKLLAHKETNPLLQNDKGETPLMIARKLQKSFISMQNASKVREASRLVELLAPATIPLNVTVQEPVNTPQARVSLQKLDPVNLPNNNNRTEAIHGPLPTLQRKEEKSLKYPDTLSKPSETVGTQSDASRNELVTVSNLSDGTGDADSDFAQAEKLDNEGKVKEAAEYYQRSSDRGNPSAQYIIGVKLRKQGALKKARLILQRSADKGNLCAENSLGCIAREEGNLEEAKRHFRRVADTGVAIAQCNLALMLERQGKIDEALEYYSLAANQNDAFAQNNLGILLRKLGKIEEAKGWYNRAISNGSVSALNNLAYIAVQEKEFTEAERLLRLALDKGNQEACVNLALVLEKKGAVSEAKKLYESGLKKGIPQAAFRLAYLLRREKSYLEAQRLFTLANKMIDEANHHDQDCVVIPI